MSSESSKARAWEEVWDQCIKLGTERKASRNGLESVLCFISNRTEQTEPEDESEHTCSECGQYKVLGKGAVTGICPTYSATVGAHPAEACFEPKSGEPELPQFVDVEIEELIGKLHVHVPAWVKYSKHLLYGRVFISELSELPKFDGFIYANGARTPYALSCRHDEAAKRPTHARFRRQS